MIKLDKKIKDYIAEHKLTDEQIYAKLIAEVKDATVTTGTPVVTKEPPKVETPATTEQGTVEKVGTATPTDSKEFTMDELGKLIADKIAEHDKAKADENTAKEQTNFSPVFENTRSDKPRFRVLKMNNR